MVDKLKQVIIDGLNLEGMTPADIDNDAPLFGENMGLDSLDAVELVMLVEKHFGVRISNSETAIKAFQSINTLVHFIESNNAKQ
jgi:acyl carrier protein